jgi:hypothetical protein
MPGELDHKELAICKADGTYDHIRAPLTTNALCARDESVDVSWCQRRMVASPLQSLLVHIAHERTCLEQLYMARRFLRQPHNLNAADMYWAQEGYGGGRAVNLVRV